MTTRPRRHHDRKPGPAAVPRHTSGPVPPGDDTTAAASPAGQDPPGGRLAYSVDEAARLTGLSRDLLYDEMRRGNLARPALKMPMIRALGVPMAGKHNAPPVGAAGRCGR